MQPIRILHFFASLDRGGAETMIMNIYRRLDRSKIQFDFIANKTDKPYAFEEEIKSLGGRVFYLPRYIIANFFSYRQAWRNLLTDHPEWKIVHAHHTAPASSFFDIAKSFGLKTIAHSHIVGHDKTIKTYISLVLLYPLRHMADYLFACSKDAGIWMFGTKRSDIYVLKNAIDVKKFRFNHQTRDKMRNELGLNDKFVIGNVSRLDFQKNHDFLIDIFKQVSLIDENAVLLLVGDGTLRNKIEEKVNRLGLQENVMFLGSRSDVPDLLHACDVFLFPTLYEGFGIAILEAQVAGLNCVVSEVVPIEVFITPLAGVMSLSDSAKLWATKVLSHKNNARRIDYSEIVTQAGYDVEDESKKLYEFYAREWK